MVNANKELRGMRRIRECVERSLEIVNSITPVMSYETRWGEKITRLVHEVDLIATALPERYERYSTFLRASLVALKHTHIPNGINAYAYGRLTRTLECLDLVLPPKSVKKVFISHSSKDKAVVEAFVDKILRLGIGIAAADIFCTSLEDLQIKNGEDIRSHIQENIIGCEYAFLLLSQNYLKSVICQNELGAIWASGAKMKIYTFPSLEIPKSIGWLCEPKVVEHLNNEHALDRLFDEMTNDFFPKSSFVNFSKQRVGFLSILNNMRM